MTMTPLIRVLRSILVLSSALSVSHAETFYRTEFETDTTPFSLPTTNITVVTNTSTLKHQHVPSIIRHSNGDLLVTCRWDSDNTSEGKDTNEQALYFSTDDGASWTMANGGYPIVTANFGRYSGWGDTAVTHSFIYQEPSGGDTWLYYTVNEPETHTYGDATKSTGGGQIRKVKLVKSGGDWVRSGSTSVVWDFMQPLSGSSDDLRPLSLNRLIRLSNGNLILPIIARKISMDTSKSPPAPFPSAGIWVLESTNGGTSWSNSYYVGDLGGEPSVIETNANGTLVLYTRHTPHHQRYLSTDYGHTWSGPTDTGMSNANSKGSKPFLFKSLAGDFFYVSANEFTLRSRYNLSIFQTDEAGLLNDQWKLCKVLRASGDSESKGSCYAWMEEVEGYFDVVFVHDKFSTSRYYDVLRFGTFSRDWLYGAEIEPIGEVYDDESNTLPTFGTFRKVSGAQSLHFSNVRSKANAPMFPGISGYPIYVSQQVNVFTAPTTLDFHLMNLRRKNGDDFGLTVSLHPSVNDHYWINANGTWTDTGITCTEDNWTQVEVWLTSDTQFKVRIGGTWVNGGNPMTKTGTDPITTYLIGGSWQNPLIKVGSDYLWDDTAEETCKVYVDDVSYGSLAGPLVYEAERLALHSSSGDADSLLKGDYASQYAVRQYDANAANDFVILKVFVPEAGTYNVKVRHRRTGGSPQCQLSIAGSDQGSVVDLYSSSVAYTEYDLGSRTLATAGDKTFKFLVTGKNGSSSGYKLYIDSITLTKL